MSTGLHELLDDDLDVALERVLVPRLAALLESRHAGHCARLTELGVPLSARLCRRIRSAVGTKAQVFVLGGLPAVPADVAVTSSKLVELRNPDSHGQQRPPLLVFVPPGTHASAEDSFGVATFEEVLLGDVYADLAARLLAELGTDLRHGLDDVLAEIDDQKWEYATSYAKARYLLTVQLNDGDPAAAGAALFELGLVPDFELFTDSAQIRTRVGRNIRQVRILDSTELPDRQRVIGLGLTDPDFQARLTKLLIDVGLEDPRTWTRRIVVDRANWPLSFHRWPLREEQRVDALRITVGDLELPRAGDHNENSQHPVLRNLSAGQPYLPTGQRGLSTLPIAFTVEPDPRQVAGLTKFGAQLISEDAGPTGITATVRRSKTARSAYSVSLKRLRNVDLEPGWHYIRVLPQDEDGIPLPVESVYNGDQRSNESERFYVVADDDLEEPPVEQRARREIGVTQALRRLEFAALSEGRDWRTVGCRAVGWKGTQGAGRHILQASFGANGSAEIPLVRALTQIQRAILGEPALLRRWRLPVAVGQAAEPLAVPLRRPTGESDAADLFAAARNAVLTAIRGDDGLVIEARDVLAIREMIQNYAQAYGELLSWQLRRAERADSEDLVQELAAMLQLDTVQVDYTDQDGRGTEVVLVAPTHPLRLLWLLTWAELGRRWLATSDQHEASVVSNAEQTLAGLTPLGFPLAVPRDGGSLAIAVGDLNPYWGVCLPTDVDDPQAVLAGLAGALRLPDRWSAGQAVSGPMLADRIERYLRQHPYVSTLVISVVNAGRAEHIADMLVELQRRSRHKAINYEVRLFTEDPSMAGHGEALAALLRGEWSSTAEAEVFHTRPAAGLIPKLAVSVRPLQEFRSATSTHPSHVTVLFDAFSGETFDAAPSDPMGMAPVHGLRQDVAVTYLEDEDTITWHKHPRHGPAYPIPEAEEISDLLASLPATISAAAAAVTTGQVGMGLVPRITLSLDAQDGALLHQAHRSSDWVITIDRTLGIEYFDNPSSDRHPDYIIDFDVRRGESLGHHIVVSSRSVDELRALLTPVADQHGLAVERRHIGTFFEQLRLLSGRLAFKLASTTPSQRTEVLGLALARLYLDYQEVLADQILLPLDSHLELYREARRKPDQVGEAVNLQRTDLALVSLDAARRTLTCRLVEVKCYSTLTGLAAYQQLKDKITQQLDRSQTVLAEYFDPHRTQPDRPDRSVRNAELATLLRFYLDRAVRHGTMSTEPATEARWLLDRLDAGYRLEFTRTGLIFDLARDGAGVETESGIEFHRVGRDLIRELTDAIPTDEYADRSLTDQTLTLPKLPAAAFRAPARSHTTPDDGPLQIEADQLADQPPPTPEQEPVPIPIEPTPVPAQDAAATQAPDVGGPDIFLGTAEPSPQYGMLGEIVGQKVALDLNETHTISLFGVQGGGKSYTLGSIIEAATLPAHPVNELPAPLATIVFHYSPTLDYAPEFTSMVAPNDDADQVQALRETYGAVPATLSDMLLLVPEDQIDQRRAAYPSIQVRPLKFSSVELRSEHWRFLMGAIGNQSTYIRQLQRIMKANRGHLSLSVIRDGVDQSSMPDNLKQLAQGRLGLAADYIDENARIKDLVHPGRMIIVDLRDEYIEKDEALGLFVVLMQLFAEAQHDGHTFNKLVVFDEAHKYIDSADLVDGLVESVREMRHKGMSVLVASQDPPSVPIDLIELSNHVILHKFTSPAWLKHLQKANASLADLTPAKLASLAPGEAYIWSNKATDNAFTRNTTKVRLRPRLTKHGGETRTAVRP